MDKQTAIVIPEHAFELRFDPIRAPGHELSFPCDERGQVNLDDLSEPSRCDYLYAHMLIGRDFVPHVVPAGGHCSH